MIVYQLGTRTSRNVFAVHLIKTNNNLDIKNYECVHNTLNCLTVFMMCLPIS